MANYRRYIVKASALRACPDVSSVISFILSSPPIHEYILYISNFGSRIQAARTHIPVLISAIILNTSHKGLSSLCLSKWGRSCMKKSPCTAFVDPNRSYMNELRV